MTARHGALFEVEFNDPRPVRIFLTPSAICRCPYDASDEDADRELYQTVYSEKPGAVAAPTTRGCTDEPLCWRRFVKGVENGVCCATRERGHFPAGACRYH